MDPEYFRLRARPFRGTPDTHCFYPATPHEFVLGRLTRALSDDEGLVLLTGDPGSGKTLIAHLLLERLGNSVNAALITNCRFASRSDMLRTLLFDLAQPYQGMGEQELRLSLTEYILNQFAAEKRTLLVLDEAQDLMPDLLEELRLLGNLETSRGKAVQVILISQPAILDTLRMPQLAVFHQRLAVRLRLDALDVHESADFLLHQIRTAGGRPERILTDEALTLIAKHTQGIPRLLNQAGHQALALAESLQLEKIDAEVVLEALAALGIEANLDDDDERPAPSLFSAPRIDVISEDPWESESEVAYSGASPEPIWNASSQPPPRAELPSRMVYGPNVTK